MFCIKSYSRKELALLYFPDSPTARAACQNFRRWMLESAATAALYTEISYKKLLNKSEVQRIVSLLGEP